MASLKNAEVPDEEQEPIDDDEFADTGERESGIDLRRLPDDAPTPRKVPIGIDFYSRVPVVHAAPEQLLLLNLDHREGYMLWLLDGVSTVEAVLDICALPTNEALVILERLVERGVVVLH